MPAQAAIYSIDQNCHPLWDVPAKLGALDTAGRTPLHLVEDIDVAFTAMGASDEDPLRLKRERFYASGGQDWGAAVFYSEFLGTLPLELRDLQPFLPHKLATVARKLGTSLEKLYDEFSPGTTGNSSGPATPAERTCTASWATSASPRPRPSCANCWKSPGETCTAASRRPRRCNVATSGSGPQNTRWKHCCRSGPTASSATCTATGSQG
ncbi:MAG: hypothetical protein ACLFV7_14260 [Phycisphaerae bacterium]